MIVEAIFIWWDSKEYIQVSMSPKQVELCGYDQKTIPKIIIDFKRELKWKNHMQFYSFSWKNLRKEIKRKKRRSKAFVLLKISGVKVFYCDVIQVKNTISLYKYTINAFKERTISVCRERQCLPNRAWSCIKDSSLRNQRWYVTIISPDPQHDVISGHSP